MTEEANIVLARFLPEYNRKFSVTAKDPELAYLKPEKDFKAEEFFCLKYERTVGADNVVRFNRKRLQVLPSPDRLSYALCKVEIQVRLNGDLAIYYQKKPLDFKLAPPEATLMRKPNLTPALVGVTMGQIVKTVIPHKPAPDHPWRDNITTRVLKRTDKFAEHIY